MKKIDAQSGFFLGFISFLLLVAALGAILVGFAINQYFASGPLLENKTVLIEQGMGVSAIADKLEEEGVIKMALLFKVGARLNPDQSFLKAGEYEFAKSISIAQALEQLKKGEVVDRKFTIREGLTSYQVVKILNAEENLSGELKVIPAEGSLLPETYHFTKGDSRADKIERMSEAMTKTIDDLWETRQEGLPIKTKKEAIILASIIEKETGVGQERTKVAGVFINRLKKGMLLQTDPTVIYALTKGKVKDDGKGPLGRRLLRKDLQIDDPYNTYKYAGLPPGPIANPGRASIEAALNPASHNYIYFVADGTGGHAFGKSLAEHNRNVAKWRQIRRSQ